MVTEHIPASPCPTKVYLGIPCGYALRVGSVAKNLRTFRESIEISQEELAERSGVKQGNISKYETGKTRPDVSTLLRLAVGLGTTVDRLVSGVNHDYDLLCHGGVKRSAPHQEVAVDPASARLFTELRETKAERDRYKTALGKVSDVAEDLASLVARIEEIGHIGASAAARGKGR